jgi:hypothetical protein
MGGAILLIAFLAGVTQAAAFPLALIGLAFLSVGIVAGAGSQAIERRVRWSGEAAARSGVRDEPTARGPYVGPSPFLVFGAALPVSLLLVALLGAGLAAIGVRSSDPAVTFLAMALQALVYVGLLRLLVVGPGALDWHEMGLGGRPLGLLVEDVAWGVVAAVPVLVGTILIAAVLLPFLPAPDSPLPRSGDGTGFLFNLLAACVVAPLGEELFFRGFATTAWARAMPARSAILRGALFFAVIHVLTVGGTGFGDATGRAVVAFVTRLPVAVALGALFVRRRSLAGPIALHATFNGLLLLLSQVSVAG